MDTQIPSEVFDAKKKKKWAEIGCKAKKDLGNSILPKNIIQIHTLVQSSSVKQFTRAWTKTKFTPFSFYKDT